MKTPSHSLSPLRTYSPLVLFFLGLLVPGAGFCPAGAAETNLVQLTSLHAFATADSVRIESALTAASDLAGAEMTIRIVHAKTGETLAQRTTARVDLRAGGANTFYHTFSGLKPQLWEPTSPVLYQARLEVHQGARMLGQGTVRFGFRSVEVSNGQLRLNGRPIFLRGLAINPPGRTIPNETGESRAFAEAYVRCLKAHNLNVFRISTDASQVWFDVCDELGMLLYAGRYGAPPGAEEGKRVAPKEFDKIIADYKTLFEIYASHPSIVLYLLANELPVSGERGAAFSALLTRAHAELRQWDPTRPIIGNAGYGEGREGDICDVHRYWGWYYNSFLTYYNLRDKLADKPLFGDPAKNQPLTFTECVGSFTGSSGEFNVVRSKQLAPSLGWIGHTDRPREDALRYQSFMVQQATESFRRLRPLNPRLAGIMPFTILFYNWSGITNFDQMKTKPAMDQIAVSYQPVLLSWECWQPQVYAGTRLRARAHVVNDDNAGRALKDAVLTYRLLDEHGTERAQGKLKLPRTIPYYGTWSDEVKLALPANLPTGRYHLCGQLLGSSAGNARATGLVSSNSIELFVAGRDWAGSTKWPGEPVWLYDPAGSTAAAFTKAGIRFQKFSADHKFPAPGAVLVIGETAWDKNLGSRKAELREFVRDGGRVLCLRPDSTQFETDWLPEPISFLKGSPNLTDYPPRTRPFAEQMNVNLERPAHPVFDGLDRYRFSLWSDYSGWDESQPGFPKIYPVTAGFKLVRAESLARTAVLADYDRGLEGVALAEFFDGAGSVILCGFDLVRRAGLDPVADRVLLNLANYAATRAGHEALPLLDGPIIWGNYPSERGLVCGSLNGLAVNAEWLVPPTNPSATPMPPNTGSWNMKPGDQFVPRGRNPLGPYGYTTASGLRETDPNSTTGTGTFWARFPAGKQSLITKVSNPADRLGELTVAINGKTLSGPVTLKAGDTVELSAPLPAGTNALAVTYTGAKSLVLVETRLE